MSRPIVAVTILQSVILLAVLVIYPAVSRLTIRSPETATAVAAPAAPRPELLRVPGIPQDYDAWARKMVERGGMEQGKLLPDMAERLLARINKEREAKRLAPLARAPNLGIAAQAHSVDMAVNGYLNAIGPNLWQAQGRVAALDRTFVGDVTEALARTGKEGKGRDRADMLFERLMDRMETMAAILSPQGKLAGVGVAEGDDAFVATVVIANPVATLTTGLPATVRTGQMLAAAVTLSSIGSPKSCSFHDTDHSQDLPEQPVADCRAPAKAGRYHLILHFAGSGRPHTGPMFTVGDGSAP
ncbi:CAP domain-containing protein [Paramagnetospirillum magneticum]|uniref:SCP domain-containing protein n=1 Tax=Paramagnetospirillum magneticum (strain ATCC 700264 / AMB-1) TaxID=342108 RepID=Q2W308_PARM1|nr:CAP domain-containing protein [Paramagnetospirillum magneticum]BAE51767.1 hypothetical protein amb2963 [Paramagnetospirillum magneticum AMB-1]